MALITSDCMPFQDYLKNLGAIYEAAHLALAPSI